MFTCSKHPLLGSETASVLLKAYWVGVVSVNHKVAALKPPCGFVSYVSLSFPFQNFTPISTTGPLIVSFLSDMGSASECHPPCGSGCYLLHIFPVGPLPTDRFYWHALM